MNRISRLFRARHHDVRRAPERLGASGDAREFWPELNLFKTVNPTYDGWARQLYQAGAEIAVIRHFRVEPSVARQVDHLPGPSGLYAFAFVARWYY